jgi:hypothetical protein
MKMLQPQLKEISHFFTQFGNYADTRDNFTFSFALQTISVKHRFTLLHDVDKQEELGYKRAILNADMR